MLTRHLAKRLASEHITVNAIAPGPFESKMMAWALQNPSCAQPSSRKCRSGGSGARTTSPASPCSRLARRRVHDRSRHPARRRHHRLRLSSGLTGAPRDYRALPDYRVLCGYGALAKYLWPAFTRNLRWVMRLVTSTLSVATKITVPSHRSSVSQRVPRTAPLA